MLLAGFSKVSISPPIGAPLAGFAARKGNCEGIHDDLFSRALVLEDDGKTIAVVSLDVLAVSSDFVSRVRANIEKRTGIKKEAIMIASTHTHAGPVTVKTFFNPEDSLDSVYMDSLGKAIEDSVAEALEKKFPARVGVGSSRVEGIGVNRRSPTKKPVDEEIGIIKVEDTNRKTRAVFINYSCHPTVLGSNNLLATGDFPYFAVEKIEQEIGNNCFAMFVNGTQGNISMGHSSELSAIGVITPGRTFEHAAELGYKLADTTLEILEDIPTDESPKLDAAVSPINFPLKDLPDIEETTQNLRQAEEELSRFSANEKGTDKFMKAMSKRLYASITNFYARETYALSDGHLPTELQAIRVGDAMFLAIPAEVFVEIGLEIKRRAKHKTFIVGIANGYIGYLPTEAAYAENGYEVVSSKVSPQAESVLYKEVFKLEERVFAQAAETSS